MHGLYRWVFHYGLQVAEYGMLFFNDFIACLQLRLTFNFMNLLIRIRHTLLHKVLIRKLLRTSELEFMNIWQDVIQIVVL